jgi:succinate dehydrogenase/fumarate reductase flavoprotein subunit
MSSGTYDKGSGKVDWETHSLRYVVNALDSAQKRQGKLWKALVAKRGKDGLIPVDWPSIEDYVESVRRTYSMMVDLETVGAEYEKKFGRTGRPRTAAKKKATRKKK